MSYIKSSNTSILLFLEFFTGRIFLISYFVENQSLTPLVNILSEQQQSLLYKFQNVQREGIGMDIRT